MPGSSKYGKLYTILLLKKLHEMGKIGHALDIGVGGGTYYELLNEHMPGIKWSGVEVWEPYIEQFSLRDKYDEIFAEDARTFDFEKLPECNLAFFGDVLEHMTKEEAQGLIDRALNKCDMALVSIPIIHYPQDEINGNPYEKHVKDDWSHEEIEASFPNIQTAFIHDHIGVYMMTPSDELGSIIYSIHRLVSDMLVKKLPEDQIVFD